MNRFNYEAIRLSSLRVSRIVRQDRLTGGKLFANGHRVSNLFYHVQGAWRHCWIISQLRAQDCAA